MFKRPVTSLCVYDNNEYDIHMVLANNEVEAWDKMAKLFDEMGRLEDPLEYYKEESCECDPDYGCDCELLEVNGANMSLLVDNENLEAYCIIKTEVM